MYANENEINQAETDMGNFDEMTMIQEEIASDVSIETLMIRFDKGTTTPGECRTLVNKGLATRMQNSTVLTDGGRSILSFLRKEGTL